MVPWSVIAVDENEQWLPANCQWQARGSSPWLGSASTTLRNLILWVHVMLTRDAHGALIEVEAMWGAVIDMQFS